MSFLAGVGGILTVRMVRMDLLVMAVVCSSMLGILLLLEDVGRGVRDGELRDGGYRVCTSHPGWSCVAKSDLE